MAFPGESILSHGMNHSGQGRRERGSPAGDKKKEKPI